jgi:hypothetical protein
LHGVINPVALRRCFSNLTSVRPSWLLSPSGHLLFVIVRLLARRGMRRSLPFVAVLWQKALTVYAFLKFLVQYASAISFCLLSTIISQTAECFATDVGSSCSLSAFVTETAVVQAWPMYSFYPARRARSQRGWRQAHMSAVCGTRGRSGTARAVPRVRRGDRGRRPPRHMRGGSRAARPVFRRSDYIPRGGRGRTCHLTPLSSQRSVSRAHC